MGENIKIQLKKIDKVKIYILLLVIIFLWPVSVLEIYSLSEETLLLRRQLPSTRKFQLQHIDCLEKKLDRYRVDYKEYLILEGEEDSQGQKEIELLVSPMHDYKVIINSDMINLTDMTPLNSQVLVKARILPRLVFCIQKKQILRKNII